MQLGRWLEDTLRDVRYAGRGLSRSPGLTAAVTLTLGLGIGSNTAIFSVVDQLLLRPLPYPAGDQLVTVYEAGRGDSGHMDVSPANWLDWQRDSRTIQTFAAWRTAALTLTGIGEPTRVRAQLVSAEFFPLLGVRPWLGRVVTPDDDRPHMPPVAVVSYEFWQQRLSGNRGAIGRTIQLDDRPIQVIGVMPPRFRFIFQDTDLWTAWQLDRRQPWRETAGRFMNVVGRLRPGTTLMGARAEMAALAGQMAGKYAFNKNTTVALVPLREELTGEVHGSLIALSVAVAVLLSIACLNVANLLLARAAARSREMAIRTSLGAGRGTIVRQWLAESLLLAAAGGGLGMLLARWILSALVAAAPPELLHVATLSIDRRGTAVRDGAIDGNRRSRGFGAGARVVASVPHLGVTRQWAHAHACASDSRDASRGPGRVDRGPLVRRRPARAHRADTERGDTRVRQRRPPDHGARRSRHALFGRRHRGLLP